jgi:hypothetical protein
MTQNSLQKVNDLLAKLHGYAYFRPDAGPLKERLTGAVLEGVSADTAEQLAEAEFGLEVNVGQQEGEEEVTVGFKVDYPGVEYRSQVGLNVLSHIELEDLATYLTPKPEEQPCPPETATGAKCIVRKNNEDDEYLEKGAAASRLKVSPEWLKSVVPCTDYSYEEIEGKKYIREYFWSRELVEKLIRIKSSKTTPEDLQYVAKECCEGDLDWARDLIGRLKSPNRPEQGAREQSQKGQGKGAPGKGQPQPARQAQAKAAQPKGQQGQPAKQVNQNAQGGNATGNATTAAAPAGEGRRHRSRHRKPFRGEGKDRKPEQGEQKQPQ